MLSIQQVIKTLRKLQNAANNGELVNHLKQQMAAISIAAPPSLPPITPTPTPSTATAIAPVLVETDSTKLSPAVVTSLLSAHVVTSAAAITTTSPKQQQEISNSSQQYKPSMYKQQQIVSETSHHEQQRHYESSLILHLKECGSTAATLTDKVSARNVNAQDLNTATATAVTTTLNSHLQRSQQIQNFYQQQLNHFHTQPNQSLCSKQKQTQFAMSSLAAEPISLKQHHQQPQDEIAISGDEASTNCSTKQSKNNSSSSSSNNKSNSNNCNSSSTASGKPCFNAGLPEILQFMELIGNLKHTKRTGWVLRDVNDCESISGHMYRMSMMTFLLDGTEGLNQIRCMELALVHDLAESLVGDITPFCGISKHDKRAMEFKAMADICKLIEPRGKRIMELFEEYEEGASAESRFVKDLDRLDMVMQAFEYEKRDDCLLKHQEFFDSTAGKFNHPFVKKLVNEIYEQRQDMAKAKGATPPPYVHVPNMEDIPSATNGHDAGTVETADSTQPEQQKSSSSSSS